MTGLVMLFSTWVKKLNPYSGATMELTKLKIAIGYLQTIKTMRMLFVSLLGVGVCLVLLLTGLVLLHCAVFFYAPWSVSVKMAVTLGCAAVYISIAAAVFAYVFSEEQWLKIFNADKMISDLAGHDQAVEPEKTEGTQFARRSSL